MKARIWNQFTNFKVDRSVDSSMAEVYVDPDELVYTSGVGYTAIRRSSDGSVLRKSSLYQ